MTIPAQFHRAKVLNFHFFLEKFEICDFPGAQLPVLFRAGGGNCPQIGHISGKLIFWDDVTFFIAMTLTIPAQFHRAKVLNFYFFLENFENNDFPGAQPPVFISGVTPKSKITPQLFPSNSKIPKIKKNFFEKK